MNGSTASAILPGVTAGVATAEGVTLDAPAVPREDEVLTRDALAFVATLCRRFRGERDALLERRRRVQESIDAGSIPGFLTETAAVREGSWRVAPAPADLADRRVEITGPTDRKMIINALNSGANVFMADFEDSNSPTWENLVSGQVNLRDAVDRSIEYAAPSGGRVYRLAGRTAVLMVRPRGWHLPEKHLLVDGKAVPASIFDFGLFVFHNAHRLLTSGTGPYLYVPKLESHLEARLWNSVCRFAEEELDIPPGAIRVTVLIETVLGAFEMEEILFELRERAAGLNCGRWDYIFSFIKKFHSRPEFLLPDRGFVTMEQPFLRAYSELLVATCHRRGTHAMGGMAAQIPVKGDPAANERAIGKVAADKKREVEAGHDGTWVAHPGLVTLARDIFDSGMPGANQIDRTVRNCTGADDLLRVPEGPVTEAGLRQNLNVGILYLAAWLEGSGCVPLYQLMEDAATAEISRSQVWQWLAHGAVLADGRRLTRQLYESIRAEEFDRLRQTAGGGSTGDTIAIAAGLFDRMITAPAFEEFLTLPAYDALLARERERSPRS